MTPAEAAVILAKASSFDARTVGRADAQSWAEALHGLDPKRCLAAVVKHYSESTERLMPAHVRHLARTTTDIVHGMHPADAARTLPDGSALCGTCKGVHGPAETCAVLVADDSRWRRALATGRAMPRLPRGQRRMLALDAPPRDVDEVTAAANDLERERQLAELAEHIETTHAEEIAS